MKRLVILLVLGLSACSGSNNPNDPTNYVQVAGSWSGTFESNYLPEGVFMEVTQVAGNVNGTWAMTTGIASGTLTGSVNLSLFSGTLTYSHGSFTCQGAFSGSVTPTIIDWRSPGFTGNCGLTAPGNPLTARFILQRR